MFPRSVMLLACCALIASPALADYKSELLARAKTLEDKFVGLAKAMPQDAMTYRPVEGVRSNAEELLHAAGAAYGVARNFGVAPPEDFNPRGFQRSTTDKDEIVAALESAFTNLTEALEGLDVADADETMTVFRREMTQRAALWNSMEHLSEHLGKLISNARANRVTPPWTAARGGGRRSSASDSSIDLEEVSKTTHNTEAEAVEFQGRDALRVTISGDARERYMEALARRRERASQGGGRPGANEAERVNYLVVLDDTSFSEGTIEVDVAGAPAPGAQGGARGFVGLAFRLQDDNDTYDAFYLRPTNGRAEDQARRNHTVQYISHPDWPWFRFRNETPSQYETYADIAPNEWIHLKIEVEGEKARLYVNNAQRPTLLVNDLKSGADADGKVALWIEGSTVAHFANLSIEPR